MLALLLLLRTVQVLVIKHQQQLQEGRSSDPIPCLLRRHTSSRTLLLSRPNPRVRVSFISTVAVAARVIATMLPVTIVSLLGPRAAS